jgi:uncharacterized protein YndB with AHSA1/START domain
MTHDAKLDLVLERVVDVPPELVWKAWTQPEHIVKWFTPAPWKTADCEVDLRVGGLFRFVMLSPEGERFPNAACYLEIVPNRKLVWTDALEAGFRPASGEPGAGFRMTAALLLEPVSGGTKYTAIAMHSDPDARKKHEAMGFHEGWGKALDQLVAHAKTMR